MSKARSFKKITYYALEKQADQMIIVENGVPKLIGPDWAMDVRKKFDSYNYPWIKTVLSLYFKNNSDLFTSASKGSPAKGTLMIKGKSQVHLISYKNNDQRHVMHFFFGERNVSEFKSQWSKFISSRTSAHGADHLNQQLDQQIDLPVQAPPPPVVNHDQSLQQPDQNVVDNKAPTLPQPSSYNQFSKKDEPTVKINSDVVLPPPIPKNIDKVSMSENTVFDHKQPSDQILGSAKVPPPIPSPADIQSVHTNESEKSNEQNQQNQQSSFLGSEVERVETIYPELINSSSASSQLSEQSSALDSGDQFDQIDIDDIVIEYSDDKSIDNIEDDDSFVEVEHDNYQQTSNQPVSFDEMSSQMNLDFSQKSDLSEHQKIDSSFESMDSFSSVKQSSSGVIDQSQQSQTDYQQQQQKQQPPQQTKQQDVEITQVKFFSEVSTDNQPVQSSQPSSQSFLTSSDSEAIDDSEFGIENSSLAQQSEFSSELQSELEQSHPQVSDSDQKWDSLEDISSNSYELSDQSAIDSEDSESSDMSELLSEQDQDVNYDENDDNENYDESYDENEEEKEEENGDENDSLLPSDSEYAQEYSQNDNIEDQEHQEFKQTSDFEELQKDQALESDIMSNEMEKSLGSFLGNEIEDFDQYLDVSNTQQNSSSQSQSIQQNLDQHPGSVEEQSDGEKTVVLSDLDNFSASATDSYYETSSVQDEKSSYQEYSLEDLGLMEKNLKTSTASETLLSSLLFYLHKNGVYQACLDDYSVTVMKKHTAGFSKKYNHISALLSQDQKSDSVSDHLLKTSHGDVFAWIKSLIDANTHTSYSSHSKKNSPFASLIYQLNNQFHFELKLIYQNSHQLLMVTNLDQRYQSDIGKIFKKDLNYIKLLADDLLTSYQSSKQYPSLEGGGLYLLNSPSEHIGSHFVHYVFKDFLEDSKQFSANVGFLTYNSIYSDKFFDNQGFTLHHSFSDDNHKIWMSYITDLYQLELDYLYLINPPLSVLKKGVLSKLINQCAQGTKVIVQLHSSSTYRGLKVLLEIIDKSSQQSLLAHGDGLLYDFVKYLKWVGCLFYHSDLSLKEVILESIHLGDEFSQMIKNFNHLQISELDYYLLWDKLASISEFTKNSIDQSLIKLVKESMLTADRGFILSPNQSYFAYLAQKAEIKLLYKEKLSKDQAQKQVDSNFAKINQAS